MFNTFVVWVRIPLSPPNREAPSYSAKMGPFCIYEYSQQSTPDRISRFPQKTYWQITLPMLLYPSAKGCGPKPEIRNGRVVELVDSLDSGSSVHCGRAGSSPASPTNFFSLWKSWYGRVVELVDSLDSGSSVHCGRAGSSPASPTRRSTSVGCASFLYMPCKNLKIMKKMLAICAGSC